MPYTELQQMIDTLRGRDDDKLCLDAADTIEELGKNTEMWKARLHDILQRLESAGFAFKPTNE